MRSSEIARLAGRRSNPVGTDRRRSAGLNWRLSPIRRLGRIRGVTVFRQDTEANAVDAQIGAGL